MEHGAAGDRSQGGADANPTGANLAARRRANHNCPSARLGIRSAASSPRGRRGKSRDHRPAGRGGMPNVTELERESRPVAAPGAPPAPERNPWLVLVVLCGAVFMVLLDSTIVNVAQQAIIDGLGASLTQIQWILDAYVLTYAVLLLSFGRLGDIFGRKKLFMLGMAIFTAASALCGASTLLGNLLGVAPAEALIAARVLQGAGGALMMPQTLALVVVVFPPEKRGAALGVWGSIVSLGAVVGPIVGGLIVTNYNWEWVFLINVPIGVAALFATASIVPESVDPLASRRLDWTGLALSSVGIFALVFGLIQGNVLGWTNPAILGLWAASLLLLTAFVWWERRTPNPMMRLELFHIRNFWVGSVIGFAFAFGMLGIFFPITLFLQGALGFSAIKAGLTTAPMSIVIMFVAPLAGRLTDRFGARWILVAGLSLATVGLLYLSRQITVETDWLMLLPALVVGGLGMGMTFAPTTTAAMAGVPDRFAGGASGILNTMRNVGQVLGIAVLGSVLQTSMERHGWDRIQSVPGLPPETQAGVVALARDSRFIDIPAALPPGHAALLPQIYGALQQAFVDSIHDTLHVGAAICVCAIALAFFIVNPRRRTAEDGEAAERRRPVVMYD
jgi:EmrB/QacA subfamily drug resistance transporter